MKQTKHGVRRVAGRQSCFAALSAVLLAAGPARAGAFLNGIQSAGAAAVSTAGQTAIAEDASTLYYNPAGLTQLNRPDLVVAAAAVDMSDSFANSGTRDALGNPVGGTSGNRDQIFPVPDMFVAAPLTGRLSAGLGLFSPFGQANGYGDGWVGRYQLQHISLKTLDIDPAVAWRLTPSLSLGGGIDIQYAHFTRASALDFGSLCFVYLSPSGCGELGLSPQGADGQLSVHAADWSVGFNLGLLYDPSPYTHIGISYRSSVGHDLSGQARFDVPAAAMPLTAGGLFQNTGVMAKLTLPELISFGIYQRIDDRFALLADIDDTRWSSLQQLSLDFANPAQSDQSLPLHWHDSIRAAVGGIYNMGDGIELRGGVSYDQTPVPAAWRSADIPDSGELMFSGGVGWRVRDGFSLLVSYSYGTFAAAPVDLAMPGAGTLAGTFHRSSNAIGVQTGLQF